MSMMVMPQPVAPLPATLGGFAATSNAQPTPEISSVDFAASVAPTTAGSPSAAFSAAFVPAATSAARAAALVGNDGSTGVETAGKDLPNPSANPASQNIPPTGKSDAFLLSGPSFPSSREAGTAIAKPDPAMSAPAKNSASAQLPTASTAAASPAQQGVGRTQSQDLSIPIDSRWIPNAAATQSQTAAGSGIPAFSVTNRGGANSNPKISQSSSSQTSATDEQNSSAIPETTAGSTAHGFESSQNGGNNGSAENPAEAPLPSINAAAFASTAPLVANSTANPSPSGATAPAPLPASVLTSLNAVLEQIQQHGDSRVDLRLPLEGGTHVDIQLRLQDGAVHASLITGSPELREALRQQWSQLASSANSTGLRLAEPAFESPSQNGSGLAQQQSHGQRQGGARDDSTPNPQAPAPSSKNAPRPTNPIQPTQTALTTWA
jgi:hypothetical protein